MVQLLAGKSGRGDMMAYEQATSGLLAGVDRAIAELEAQARGLQEAAPYGSTQRGAAAPAVAGTPSLDDLALTLSHLKQIKDYLTSDPHLLPLVDSFIGQKVKASEKRTNAMNAWIAVATTIVGAILGWLVSGILPQHLFH
jgi:hypothetical protein